MTVFICYPSFAEKLVPEVGGCNLLVITRLAGKTPSVWETGCFKVVILSSQADSFIVTYLP
jgi:hypothetical protein